MLFENLFALILSITIGNLTPMIQDSSTSPTGIFTPDEALTIQKLWATPGRYQVNKARDAGSKGEWQVRLTAEGSIWLWNYNKARGLGKVNPNIDASALTPEQQIWENWIDRQIAFDRQAATAEAQKKNRSELPAFEAPGGSDPGPAPEGLVRLAGTPPVFASAVKVREHTITFEDGLKLSYQDNVRMRPRYAYYRFPQGVQSFGVSVTKMDPAELNRLFDKAGLDSAVQKIMKSVSLLEGGFDSVNTYDTGYVSVGVIQFACLGEGKGSLGPVLVAMKRDYPSEFSSEFRRFGLDVTADGELIALDIQSGEVRKGTDAAMQIIEDPRLVAVFQRAGQHDPFRISQLKVAYQNFYPANDVMSASIGSKRIQFRVGDLIRSEAGLATLMDRKVNTGNIRVLSEAVSQVAAESGITQLSDLSRMESEIIRMVRWRKDYLSDGSLSQPGARGNQTSRGGATKRGARTPKSKSRRV